MKNKSSNLKKILSNVPYTNPIILLKTVHNRAHFVVEGLAMRYHYSGREDVP